MDNNHRILVLAPDDPAADPRVLWVARLCAELARTDALGLVYDTPRPWKEYDGRLFIERLLILENADGRTLGLLKKAGRLFMRGSTQRYLAQRRADLAERFVPLRDPAAAADTTVFKQPWFFTRLFQGCKDLLARWDLRRGAKNRYRALAGFRQASENLLCLAARSRSVPPDLVVCHDLPSLPAGLWLKERYGTRVVYECHECWPEADLMSPHWEMRAWERQERPLIQRADLVVTVSPPLEDYLRQLYGLKNTLCVPNAAPLEDVATPACTRSPGGSVRFLFQGGAAPGRGLEMLLDTWSRWADPRAILALRCPDHEYLQGLRSRFAQATARGLVEFLPAVPEEQLIQAACRADVGLIPYPPSNRNHQFCGPNKLGQYLQAGLALLAVRSDYVGPCLERWGCGLSYHGFSAASLLKQARRLVDEPTLLQAMKSQARHAALSEFHWDHVARPYRQRLAELLASRGDRQRPLAA